jgi:hypothetical protein
MHETWYERAAWIYFALLTGTVLPLALMALVDPSSATDLWARFGYDLPPAVAADPAATEYVEFIGHWAATGTIGFDLFGLLIAVTAFRKGQRWAWLAFWYWPVLFATHFVTYTSAFRYAQLLWLALSVGALLATYRKVWARPAVRREAVAPYDPAR